MESRRGMVNPGSVEEQKLFQRSADYHILTLCRVFNEVQTGPNPLTPREVRSLVETRPEVYGVLRAFAECA